METLGRKVSRSHSGSPARGGTGSPARGVAGGPGASRSPRTPSAGAHSTLKWKKHCSAIAESYIRATRSPSFSQLPLLYPRSPQPDCPAPCSPGPPRPLPCLMPGHVEHHCSSQHHQHQHHQPLPLAHLRHLQSPRRHSWGGCTPETARDLQWSSPLDARSPFSTVLWEGSPLRGSPAKRLFSWSSWQREAEQSEEDDDLVFDLKQLELR